MNVPAPAAALCLLPPPTSNAASYVSLVTVHWYKATKETPNTPASLLDEGPIRVEMDNLRQLVQVANGFGKPLRCVCVCVFVCVHAGGGRCKQLLTRASLGLFALTGVPR